MAEGGSRTLERFVPEAFDDWDTVAGSMRWHETDATVCFADISGFTALSERLAAQGRLGSEELVRLIGALMDRMLTEASGFGGRLINFGGDALLLEFRGDDHERRGASAAVALRKVIAEATSWKTLVGRLRLRISIGLAAGSMDLIRVGHDFETIVASGAAVRRAIAAESAASPGEILIDRELAARLGITADRDLIPLPWRQPRARAETPPRRRLDDDLIERGVPTALIDIIRHGVQADHRSGLIAFLEIGGFERLRSDHDIADRVRILDGTLDRISLEAAAEGVALLATDASSDGFRVLLATGAPIRQEDDAGRLLRCCQRIVADAYESLTVRIGVNDGVLFSSEVGSERRATYVAMGDAVNTAARMMVRTPPGHLYASPSALGVSRTGFETRPVDPFPAKGKSELVHVVDVGRPTGPKQTRTDDLDFVGRDDLLRDLRIRLDGGLRGEGARIDIVGLRGMGKTRIASELLDGLAVTVHGLRADPYAAASPYRAMRDVARGMLGLDDVDDHETIAAIRSALASIDDELAAFLPLLGDVLHLDLPDTETTRQLDPRYRRERLADVVVGLLRLSADDAQVLLIDDAQWVDEASAELLGRISDALRGQPWVILSLRRPDATGFVMADVASVRLEPLDDTVTRAMLDVETEGLAARRDELERLVSRIGGNPLFLSELIRTIRTTGSVPDLPSSIEEVMGTRIDRVPVPLRRVLAQASVLGQRCRIDVLDAMWADGDVREAVEFDLAEFLAIDGGNHLRFRHPLVRDCLYDSLNRLDRRRYHLDAARILGDIIPEQSRGRAAALSLHHLEGNDYERARTLSIAAAAEAEEQSAFAEAALHHGRVLRSVAALGGEPDEIRRIEISLGTALERAGRYPEAIEVFVRAGRRPMDDRDRADLKLRLSRAAMNAGRYRVALRAITAARGLLPDDAGAERARLSAHESMVRIAQQRPDLAIRAADRALREATVASGDIRDAHARALQSRSIGLLMMGRFDEATDLERAATIYDELGDLPASAAVLGTLGGRDFLVGRWTSAVVHYQRSRDLDRSIGNEAGAASAEANLGELFVSAGRHAEAAELLRRSLRTARGSGYGDLVPFVLLNLGRALTGLSDWDRALALFEECAELADEMGHGHTAGEARVERDLLRTRLDADHLGDIAGEDFPLHAALLDAARLCADDRDAASRRLRSALADDGLLDIDRLRLLDAADWEPTIDLRLEEERNALRQRLWAR